MKKSRFLMVPVALACLCTTVSCLRNDQKNAEIQVPQMQSARDVRIVTNAALDEVEGHFNTPKHDYQIDLSNGIVLYHESRRLLLPEYRASIVQKLEEVGFKARFLQVQHNPPPLLMTAEGPKQTWPDRFTSIIQVADMTNNVCANVVVDAIAYARLGRDDPRVMTDPGKRRLTAAYNGKNLAMKNIETAIACVGFDANHITALPPDLTMPHGWSPVEIARK